MEQGAWSMEHGAWSMEQGAWRVMFCYNEPGKSFLLQIELVWIEATLAQTEIMGLVD